MAIEFSKRELQIFLDCLSPFHFLYPETFDEVKNKLIEAVDAYCEHKNTGQDYSCTRCWDCMECW